MMATLSEVVRDADARAYAVAGLVCLGWEDARAYVAAAEAERAPVILQAGPGARRHTPLRVWGAMLRELGEGASVPVVAHLDHGASAQECEAAIAHGFTSVMFDGSREPLDVNVARTAAIARTAHAAGVSCEGEIGFVGYEGGEGSAGTDAREAARFAAETGVDAMAVSVGNVHLQRDRQGGIDEARLRAIEAATSVPLVIHGGSGVPTAQRGWLASTSRVAKVNIGTELRMAFGRALRGALADDPDAFDRAEILARVEPPLTAAAREVIAGLGGTGRA